MMMLLGCLGEREWVRGRKQGGQKLYFGPGLVEGRRGAYEDDNGIRHLLHSCEQQGQDVEEEASSRRVDFICRFVGE